MAASTDRAGSADIRALEARLAQLAEEIRAYPTPIAGCDAQLGGLLEERALRQAALSDPKESAASLSEAPCRAPAPRP